MAATPARNQAAPSRSRLAAPTVRAILCLALALAAGGCRERPKAPPLVNEAVYQNDKIGLRFLPPDRWSVTSRADLPAGALSKPVILVAYQVGKGESSAELEVMAADVPEGTDLGQFLVAERIGAAAWALKPQVERVTVNGSEATRHVLTRKAAKGEASKGEVVREATAFRRGGRVYFFVTTFAATDASNRDAARQCVQSVTWSQ
jgi:hypothetical protein